jgi:maleate cis-trans isomerase
VHTSGLPDIRSIDYGDRLRLGIIVPSGNVVAEPEIASMLPPGVRAYFTRLPLRGSSKEELMGMLDGLDQATELLADAAPDLMVFHCTAVTTYEPSLGHAVRDRMSAISGIATVATSEALVAARQALGIRDVALLTPYLADPHEREIRFLNEHGFDVVSDANLGIDTNTEMAALKPAELFDFVVQNQSPDAEGYLLSCTALRSAGIIEPLEALLGKPVITSNQAMVWHALRVGGAMDNVPGFGRLFQEGGDADIDANREAVGATVDRPSTAGP